MISLVDDSGASRAVRLSGVRFGWSAERPLINIDCLSIAYGEHVLIQGASGSGKTTLLNLLAGVLVPQSGFVEVSGVRISSLSASQRDHFRADHIGFIFQQFNLIPYLSVRENVSLPLAFSSRGSKAVDSRARQHVDELIQALELDAKDIGDRQVTTLSIGQQQRIAAARALVGAPKIVIADEPTSALDSDAREAFLRLLFAECDRSAITLVFVSHDRSLAPLFDRTISMNSVNPRFH